MLMVKPGMAYLDIVRDVKNKVPYTVSMSFVPYVECVHFWLVIPKLQHPYHPLAIYQVP